MKFIKTELFLINKFIVDGIQVQIEKDLNKGSENIIICDLVIKILNFEFSQKTFDSFHSRLDLNVSPSKIS